ncbi:unnamed protein product, partial [Mesorhabditis spiculigera]
MDGSGHPAGQHRRLCAAKGSIRDERAVHERPHDSVDEFVVVKSGVGRPLERLRGDVCDGRRGNHVPRIPRDDRSPASPKETIGYLVVVTPTLQLFCKALNWTCLEPVIRRYCPPCKTRLAKLAQFISGGGSTVALGGLWLTTGLGWAASPLPMVCIVVHAALYSMLYLVLPVGNVIGALLSAPLTTAFGCKRALIGGRAAVSGAPEGPEQAEEIVSGP